jgi:cathepsin L
MGCNGGLMDYAFNYVQNVSLGVNTDASYPYTATDGQCKFNSTNIAGTCSGHVDVDRSEAALQAAVTNRVVSAAIFANIDDFIFYKSGIFDSNECTRYDDPDWAVSIVGFNSTAKYWIVRNNWGTDWGESGYIRMVMGKNMCGLANRASYPLA